MKTKLVFSTMLVSILACSSVFAGQSTGGYISHIATVYSAIHGHSTILFLVTGGTESGRPSCATTRRFAAPMNSAHYQAIITAFQLKTAVKLGSVYGSGTCNNWYNSEDLVWIEINQ